jgi:hypothetical protein
MNKSNLRCLPSVDKIISDERIKNLEDSYPHSLMVGLTRKRLEKEASDKKDDDLLDGLGDNCIKP